MRRNVVVVRVIAVMMKNQVFKATWQRKIPKEPLENIYRCCETSGPTKVSPARRSSTR